MHPDAAPLRTPARPLPRSRHQFVQALYLIECVKRGIPTPAALPPGPFPPVVGAVSIGGMQAGAPADIYSAQLSIPGMAPRASYQPQPPAQLPFASQVRRPAGAGQLGAARLGAAAAAAAGTLVGAPLSAANHAHLASIHASTQVPGLNKERVSALDAADQLRLEGEREAALAAEAEQRKAEEERMASLAKKEFFTRSLADMRLAQSKVQRAVVEAQQR